MRTRVGFLSGTFRRTNTLVGVYLSILAFGIFYTRAADISPSQPSTNALSAAEDRKRMMELLHLSEPGLFPPTAQDPKRPPNLVQRPGNTNNWYDDLGNTYVRSSWGNWSNYGESKASRYPLPNPLVLKDGKPVKDAETWWKQRRPEILNDYLTEIYGRTPPNTPTVNWEVSQIETNVGGIAAIMKTIVGRIDNSRYTNANPSIHVSLYTPANASAPVPVMVIATPGPFSRRPAPANNASGTNALRNFAPGFGGPGPMPLLLKRGWGYATFSTTLVQADNGAGLTQGIIGLVSEGRPRKPDDWGVLSAWSWGLSRALDYFEKDKSVDAKKIGIEGHSRWGKTALLAAALDQRWAIVYCSCSGAMGASLEKRNWGETIDNVAGAGEYHWMAGNFLKYGGHWDKMPVDAHELIALVAPRPIFVTGGTQDQWADPHGEFLACLGAGPVYRLLGKKDVGTSEMPAPDAELISGDIGFRYHAGGHTDSLDWPTFLKFADKYFR